MILRPETPGAPAPAGSSPSGGAQRAIDVSAIIVCFGDPRPLYNCLESLLTRCRVRPSAVLLVDNNPPPRRLRAEALPPAFREIGGEIVVPGENVGFGRGVNLACARVRTGYALVINPDLVLEPDALETLFHTLARDPRVAVVGPALYNEGAERPETPRRRSPGLGGDLLGLSGLGRLLAPSGRGRKLRAVRPPEGGEGSPGSDAREASPSESGPLECSFLSGACLLLRMEAFTGVGGFDPRFFLYYEDADLCRRLHRAGWKLLLLPAARARHAHGASFSDPVSRQAASLRGALLYHRKYGGPLGGVVYRAGLLLLYVPRLLLGFASYLPGAPRAHWSPGQRARMIGAVARIALGDGA